MEDFDQCVSCGTSLVSFLSVDKVKHLENCTGVAGHTSTKRKKKSIIQRTANIAPKAKVNKKRKTRWLPKVEGGTVEAIEKRIQEVDRDIESLQKQREDLGNFFCMIFISIRV